MQEGKTDLGLDRCKRQLVNEALAAILATEKFECSPQMTAFLRYVVEQAADGNQSRIKAFSVAVDALGKPNSFDPQNDPVVRVLAGRLRTALDVYHDEHPNVPVSISMRKGSYVPIFSGPGIDGKHHQERALDQPPGRALNINSEPQTHVPVTRANVSLTPSNPANSHNDVTSQNSANASAGTTSSIKDGYTVAGENATDNTKPFDAAAVGEPPRENNKKPWTGQAPSHFFGRHLGDSRSRWIAAAAVLATFTLLQLKDANRNIEPTLQAATMVPSPSNYRDHSKPSNPNVYISAINNGDAIQDSLNAIISDALYGDSDVLVHRILENEQRMQYWKEDYILSLTSLNLEGTMHVNLQVISAMDGRVIHSEPVLLDLIDGSGLSSKVVAEVVDTAKSLVSLNGPVLTDFNAQVVYEANVQ